MNQPNTFSSGNIEGLTAEFTGTGQAQINQPVTSSSDESEGIILQPTGIRQAQIAVWRPSNGTWSVRRPDGSIAEIHWGMINDVPVPADYEYDGEGRADIGVWRPSDGNWYILRNAAIGHQLIKFGQEGDRPVPADYNGDGLADLAVVRPDTTNTDPAQRGLHWFINRSDGTASNFFGFPFGLNDDIPVPADYDGDGKADVAVFRPSNKTWYILRSSFAEQPASYFEKEFLYVQVEPVQPPEQPVEQPKDIPVPADYDGDGKAELALWRPGKLEPGKLEQPGMWVVRRLDGTLLANIPIGKRGDVPVPADYDGDGRVEIAVWRPSDGRWDIRRLDGSVYDDTIRLGWGREGDIPVPAPYIGTGIRPRQSLSRSQRADANVNQTVRRPPYDVPFPYDTRLPNTPDLETLTPDEMQFQKFAASFHKLLPHDPTTGLLNDNGIQNYERLRQGLRDDNSLTTGNRPSSDFNTTVLNNVELLYRNPPGGRRPRVLINPRSSKALSIKGPDVASLRVSRILYGIENEKRLLQEISLGSDYTAAELVELYAQALLRRVELGRYEVAKKEDRELAELAVRALNSFGTFFVWGYRPNGMPITAAERPITLQNLFRGSSGGDLASDYLSLFLTLPRPPIFPSGCASHVADLIGASQFAPLLSEPLRVPQQFPDVEFGTTRQSYARLQNAEIPEQYPSNLFNGLGPIKTGRDLGNYVHVDNVYEWAIRAADILTGNQYNRPLNSPYTDGPEPRYPNEGDGPTLGSSDAYALIGSVREVAERAAFTQKWLVARRARPEVMAALVDLTLGGTNVGPISEKLIKPNADVLKLLDKIRERNREQNLIQPPPPPLDPNNPVNRNGERNLLLTQMYPEGSPAHPAWPSGHATVAGATVTVIKAIWNDRQEIILPNQPSKSKFDEPLDAFVAPDRSRPTVGGELDKLASNIAFGRNWGGVHYRTDGEQGILLGEEVAIRYLQDHAREYREQFRINRGFELTKRNGQRIRIAPHAVLNIPDQPTDQVPPMIFPKSLL